MGVDRWNAARMSKVCGVLERVDARAAILRRNNTDGKRPLIEVKDATSGVMLAYGRNLDTIFFQRCL
jgi:hypothetical protein